MTDANLLSCPHCGGTPLICNGQSIQHVDTFIVECPRCDSEAVNRADAIAAWNLRAGPQWSNEPPTVAGYYWIRYVRDGPFDMARVNFNIPNRMATIVEGSLFFIDDLPATCQWSGPLPTPPED